MGQELNEWIERIACGRRMRRVFFVLYFALMGCFILIAYKSSADVTCDTFDAQDGLYQAIYIGAVVETVERCRPPLTPVNANEVLAEIRRLCAMPDNARTSVGPLIDAIAETN